MALPSKVLTLSQYCKSGSTFHQASLLRPAATATDSETPCVRTRPVESGSTRPSCAEARPKELCHWISSQKLRLSSGIAFGSDCQMTCRGSNLDSNLNSAAAVPPAQRVVQVLSAHKTFSGIPEWTVLIFQFFLGLLTMPKWRQSAEWFPTLIPQDVDRVSTPNMNIWLPLFGCIWSQGSLASCEESVRDLSNFKCSSSTLARGSTAISRYHLYFLNLQCIIISKGKAIYARLWLSQQCYHCYQPGE